MLYTPNLFGFIISDAENMCRGCEHRPVTHRETFEFPFVPEDILEDIFVLRYVGPVDAIVPVGLKSVKSLCTSSYHSRSHHCPWFGIFLGQHERHQVDFAQSTFTENTVIRESVILLVVTSVDFSLSVRP